VIAMTLGEIAAVVDGAVDPLLADELVTGAAFVDSRSPVPGGLFVALPGERVDGHAACVLKGGADRSRLALVTGMSNELGARRGSDVRGAIGRAIVHDQRLVTG